MSAAPLTAEDELLAAELALGLIERDTDADARMAADLAFAAAHDRWLSEAVTMAGVHAERPPADLWERVRARLPVDDRVSHTAPLGKRWWMNVAAGVLAFAGGWAGGHWTAAPTIVHVSPPAPRAPSPLLAVLTGSDGRAVLAVSFAPGGDRLAVAPKAVEPGRRVPELWVIPVGGKPHTLGVLPSSHPSWHAVDRSATDYLHTGATLAVSLEPEGGSPTGLPTGPVILTGTLTTPS